MMKRFILTLTIYMAIVSGAEKENRNINFGDLIVHNAKAEFMDTIGTVSEAIAAMGGKVMETGANADILKLQNEIPCLNGPHLHLTGGGVFLIENSSGN